MKRTYLIGGGIAVVLVVLALSFLPSYFAKQGIDELAASLPSGAKFTYDDASYSLFSRALVLKGGVLHVADPVFDIDVAEIRIQDGNPGLARAVRKALAEQVADQDGTRIAGAITLTGLHTVYGPLDSRIAAIDIESPRLFLGDLLASLPPLKEGPSVLDAVAEGAQLRDILQRAARVNLAIAFDKAVLHDSEFVASDHVSGQSVKARVGTLESDGFDRGDIKGGHLADFALEANGGAITVGSITTGGSSQRAFLNDLRDGDPLETAFNHYQGVSQTIDNVALKSADVTLGSIQQLTIGNLAYQDGLPVAVDVGVRNLAVDPSIIPMSGPSSVLTSLGYKPANFNAALSYKWDKATQQVTIANSNLVLDKGGTLNVDAVFTGFLPAAPQNGKIASLTVRYEDNSLATRWLDYVAKLTGQGVPQVKAGYVSWLQGQKPHFAGDLPLAAAVDAAAKFVNDPHILTLTIKPPAPVGLADFDRAHPELFSSKLGLSVGRSVRD